RFRIVGPAKLDPAAVFAAIGTAMDATRDGVRQPCKGWFAHQCLTFVIGPGDAMLVEIDRERHRAWYRVPDVVECYLLLENVVHRQCFAKHCGNLAEERTRRIDENVRTP